MTTLNGVLAVVLTGGGAAFLWALFRGLGLIRTGVVRTEARAIQKLEQYRDEADDRARRVGHRLDYQVTLTEYYRSNYADLAYRVREEWGAEHLPAVPPIPVYQPLPRGKQPKQVTDDE
jgi:hypothetical protein